MKNLLKCKAAPQDAEYTVISLNSDGNVIVTVPHFTIIFKDYDGSLISEKEYKYGETVEVPSDPQREDYDFLGWGDVTIDKAVANMTFIAQYEVTPKVTITTMDGSYTDTSSIALNATKTETVTGELSFTTDLDSDIAHIIDNVLIFDKHYEGTINILASALDKHSNIQSDSKTITVSCNVAATVKCVVSNVTADDVEADATSATIKYGCNVTTTTHAGVSNTVVAHKEKTVTFEANESEEDVTRSGSFTCEHGETVEWSVIQKGYKEPMPKDNQIWYKTNNRAVIVPQNMSPTTNTYTNKGVMTFASNVTSIASSAFMSKSTLTEFYGGMSLTTVGERAFWSCSNLMTIDLPSCTSVSSNAFRNCSILRIVNLPNCTSVGDYAFVDCTGLASIDLPSCTTVGSYAFYNCYTLTSIDLPSCTSVGSVAFYSCRSLTSIDLPNCTSVGSNAFQNCYTLTSIDLPSCTSVGNSAFYTCTRLTSINLPNCGTVGDNAFTNCSSLTSIDLPSCTTVGSNAFQNCYTLTSIDLPSCTSVGSVAFYSCRSLTSVNLPNCANVGSSAFAYCYSLTSVNLPNCANVGSSAFAYCYSLTSVNLPNCANVGSFAFLECSSLTSINLPNCTSVGGWTFYGCSTLTTVTLGASTMCTLGNSYAFTSCRTLTSIYVTASLVDTYKADSVWSWFADKIVPIA